MIPINNSDTWLIVSDYNQENSLPYEDLKEDIYCPSINVEHWDDYTGLTVSVWNANKSVGAGDFNVGMAHNHAGQTNDAVGGIGWGELVGGSHFNWIQ